VPTRTSYAPGTPCWVDLAAPDLAAAVNFYSALFDWEAEDMGAQFMHYHQFTKDGERVAGLGPIMNEGQPPAWMTYIASSDLAATAATVRDAGGQVVVEPMEIPGAGHMAVFTDDEGTAFAGWQAIDHPGCGLVNEPGTLAWNEVNRRDVEGAKAFYTTVFGWGTETAEMPGAGPYTTWKVGDDTVGGMIQMDDAWEGMPPSWMTYFAVEDADADAAVARIEELGGKGLMPPFDTPAGRIAVVADPGGANFSVIALDPDFSAS
jgi:predicted enzyme related to lactoylglutathione lyase